MGNQNLAGDVEVARKRKSPPRKQTLADIVKNIPGDAAKITAVSAAMAFFSLTETCYKLPQQIGINYEISGLQGAIMAFDVGAGAFAGYTKKHITSAVVYFATVVPDANEVFANGNVEDGLQRILAKTIIYGGSYFLGHIFSDKS